MAELGVAASHESRCLTGMQWLAVPTSGGKHGVVRLLQRARHYSAGTCYLQSATPDPAIILIWRCASKHVAAGPWFPTRHLITTVECEMSRTFLTCTDAGLISVRTEQPRVRHFHRLQNRDDALTNRERTTLTS